MNRKSVIIKSNKYGLTVILDDKMPFQELLLDIADKFQESANFFRNAKMAVQFASISLVHMVFIPCRSAASGKPAIPSKRLPNVMC